MEDQKIVSQDSGTSSVQRFATTLQMEIILSGGLTSLPMLSDEILYVDTKGAADLLGVSTRWIRELVTDWGLPRVGSDRFYIPHLMNFQRVKGLAEQFGKKPKDLSYLGFIDFTLTGEGGPIIDLKLSKKPQKKTIQGGNRRG